MKKFEYLRKRYNQPIDQYDINKKGKEGWELINILVKNGDYYIHYFKREIEEKK